MRASVAAISASRLSSMSQRIIIGWLLVSVPVLSLQIVVAPPIVSQASSTLTKLLSFIIFIMEYASEMVTARGRPSGTATTMMVIAKMKNSRMWLMSATPNPEFFEK